MIPKYIKEWKSNTYYYLDDIDKDLTYHLYLQYKGITREIFKEEINGTKYYAWDFWYLKPLAGWVVNKETWFNKEKEDLQRVEWDHIPGVGITRHFYNKNKLQRYFKTLKYVYPNKYDENVDIWEFIKMLYKYPQMENVYKCEAIRHLWHDERIYKLKSDKKKMFYSFVLQNGRKMWAHSFNEILWCSQQNKKTTKNDYKKYLENNFWEKQFKNISGSYFNKRYENLIKKHGKKWVLQEYKDYYGAIKKLSINNLYPRDLIKAHDAVMDQLDLKDNHRIITIKKYKQLRKLLPNNVNLPQTQGELRVLGRKMSNCVGTYDYGDRMKRNECLILSVKRKNKFIACCELSMPKLKIEQLYGPHNSNKNMKEPRKYINEFINNMRGFKNETRYY